MAKRVFLIVLDSFGIGGDPEAEKYGDGGSNTLAALAASPCFSAENLRRAGLFNIDGVSCAPGADAPLGAYARLREASAGKDTTVGHWEIAGCESKKPLPVFPQGFPREFVSRLSRRIGRGILCNKPYSGTEVIRDYGEEHMKTGAIILYTSADSVCQIAANEETVPLQELYRICEIAREMLCGDIGVGRVIARPFTGKDRDSFTRTANRHDYSLSVPGEAMPRLLADSGYDVISVGKIYDIFNGEGINRKIPAKNNTQAMDAVLTLAREDFCGLAFINLVDFDMVYGHRNDTDGYARAASDFDLRLGELLPLLSEEDILIITADHGCDPSTPSTDHSRECVPLIFLGDRVKPGENLGTLYGFSVIAKTVCEYFGVKNSLPRESVLHRILK